MSLRPKRVSPYLFAAHWTSSEVYGLTFRFGVPRAFRCSRGKDVRIPHTVSWYQIHHRLRLCCDSFFICIFLRSIRHRLKTIYGTEVADVEQTQKTSPFITCEISLCQYVCELVLGVNVFDLDLGVQINSIEQPIKSNSVGSGNMSHCRASSLYDHLHHYLVVFKDVQQSFLTRRIHVWEKQHCSNHQLLRGWIRPSGQTPQLAECQWLISLALSTWRKRFRTEYKKKWKEKSKG